MFLQAFLRGRPGREVSKARGLPTSGPEGIAEMDSLAIETLAKLEAESPDTALRMEDTLWRTGTKSLPDDGPAKK